MKTNIIKLMLTLFFCMGVTVNYTPKNGLHLNVGTQTLAIFLSDGFSYGDYDDDMSAADYYTSVGSGGGGGGGSAGGSGGSGGGSGGGGNSSGTYWGPDGFCFGCGITSTGLQDGIGTTSGSGSSNSSGESSDTGNDGVNWDMGVHTTGGGGGENGESDFDYAYEDNEEPEDETSESGKPEDNEEPEKEEECKGNVCQICGKFISVTQGKDCEMCEGHDEEPEDCTGVKGGKAYTRTNCNGETVCVDGNVGMVDNQLPSGAAEAFNEVIETMQDNCLQVALLNNLNPNYGLTVQLGNISNAAGGFSSCDYSIIFPSAGNIDYRSVTAELFHAYQEQYLNGKLSQISTDFANNHIGGSNTEFEEKAVIMFIGMMQYGYATPPGQEKLEAWLDNLMKNHDFSSEVILTEIEINAWFEAMEEFQQHWQQLDPDSLYGKPIDRDMLPNSLLSLLSNSGCTGY